MEAKFLVPIVTPFKDETTVNYKALQALVQKVLKEGADGIYAGGSSAECFSLDEAERKKVLEAVIEAAEGAFVVAHIGAIGTNNSVKLARHAQRAGADAVSSVPPFYFSYRFEEIKNYYLDLLASVDLPMMIYNIPSTTKTSFTLDQFLELMNCDGVGYLKFTDDDFYLLEQIKSHCDKTVFSGKDEDFLSALAAGADGAIGTTFNFMLGKYLRISDLYKQGKMKEALAVQHSANEVITTVCDCGLLEATKYILSLQGIDAGHARKPFSYLTEEQKARLRAVAEKEGLLDSSTDCFCGRATF